MCFDRGALDGEGVGRTTQQRSEGDSEAFEKRVEQGLKAVGEVYQLALRPSTSSEQVGEEELGFQDGDLDIDVDNAADILTIGVLLDSQESRISSSSTADQSSEEEIAWEDVALDAGMNWEIVDASKGKKGEKNEFGGMYYTYMLLQSLQYIYQIMVDVIDQAPTHHSTSVHRAITD